MKMWHKIITTLLFVFTGLVLFCQNLNTSPYTRFGLGEINKPITTHYQGMGGLSVSYSDFHMVNISNPATYSTLRKNNPVFDLGISGKMSNYKAESNGEINTSQGNNFLLNNMILGLPVTKRCGVTLGLLPYSTVGYDISSNTLLSSDTVTYNYRGDGSVNRILLGTGYDVINKGDTTRFSLGLNASYIFGTLNRNNSVIFQEGTFYNTRVQNKMTLSGFSFDAGIHFYQEVKGKAENDIWVYQLGATQAFSSQIGARRDFYAYSFIYNFSVQEIPKDTTYFYEDQTGNITLPDHFSIGMNLGRNKQNKNVWSIGAQFNISNWDIYKEVFDNIASENQDLSQMTELIIGGRITPTLDFDDKNKNSFQKSTYSFGFKYGNSFININDQQLTNYGMNFGISIPLLSSRSLSRVNISTELGRMGTIENELIEESYLKLSIGFSLAPDTRYDRWFKKRKYD